MTNSTTENIVLIFSHFDRYMATFEKNNEFLNFYMKFFQIWEFQLRIFGQKVGQSAKNFSQKYSLVLYFYQKNIQSYTIITE